MRTRLEGLEPGQTYYFRALAMNSGGTVWAASSEFFTTQVPRVPVVENHPANGISGTAANLRGAVIDEGLDPPMVTIFLVAMDSGSTISTRSAVPFPQVPK